jgi:sugar phosphate isomerase/epimerase
MPNLRFLGPLFDEIEIVLFDSRHPESLPTEAEIAEIAVLGRELGITCNVHLPIDVYLGSADTKERLDACDTILQYYERTLPLGPSAYILHLEQDGGNTGIDELADWRRRLRLSLEGLMNRGVKPENVAVENLDYPFPWVDILVEEYGMTYCLDIGHFLKQDVNLSTTFNQYGDRTAMIHLHGKDHQALTAIPDPDWLAVTETLRRYRGGLSLEVFSLEALRDSLTRMAELV